MARRKKKERGKREVKRDKMTIISSSCGDLAEKREGRDRKERKEKPVLTRKDEESQELSSLYRQKRGPFLSTTTTRALFLSP